VGLSTCNKGRSTLERPFCFDSGQKRGLVVFTMPRKSNSDAFVPNTKTFTKLLAKRESIQKSIARQQKKIQKVDSELGKYSGWLATLTAAKQ